MGCCVLLCVPAQGQQQKIEGPTPQCTNINTINFLCINKIVMCKPMNEAGLLQYIFYK